MRTIRTVIDPGGQTVSALDRLYLAAHIPTLIVWGERDQIIPVAHAHAAHEAIAGSRLEILPNVGHFPYSEAPVQFLAVLTDFLATTSPGVNGAPSLQDVLRSVRERTSCPNEGRAEEEGNE